MGGYLETILEMALAYGRLAKNVTDTFTTINTHAPSEFHEEAMICSGQGLP